LAGADGTRSILDILKIAPEPSYCAAAPLTPDEYHRYFGTERPSLDTVRNSEDLWEELERGMARYVLAYEGDRPTKIVFVGYSFD
jgi:hypothetical protein